MLVQVLHLCVRLRLQEVDSEDVTDTLALSGYPPEEGEELLGRLVSVVDSTDHFLCQTIAVLEQVWEGSLATADIMYLENLWCALFRDSCALFRDI